MRWSWWEGERNGRSLDLKIFRGRLPKGEKVKRKVALSFPHCPSQNHSIVIILINNSTRRPARHFFSSSSFSFFPFSFLFRSFLFFRGSRASGLTTPEPHSGQTFAPVRCSEFSRLLTFVFQGPTAAATPSFVSLQQFSPSSPLVSPQLA